jgi:hypothetical protein
VVFCQGKIFAGAHLGRGALERQKYVFNEIIFN